jgi:hypothetical protein
VSVLNSLLGAWFLRHHVAFRRLRYCKRGFSLGIAGFHASDKEQTRALFRGFSFFGQLMRRWVDTARSAEDAPAVEARRRHAEIKERESKERQGSQQLLAAVIAKLQAAKDNKSRSAALPMPAADELSMGELSLEPADYG